MSLLDNAATAFVSARSDVQIWTPEPTHPVGDQVRDFETLYREMLPVVYRYLALRAGAEAAEEITNDVFLAVVRSPECSNAATLTEPWIMAIAKNKLIDHWRRADSKRRYDQKNGPRVEDFSEPSAEVAVLANSSEALKTLDKLPSHYRALLTLRYIDDMSVAQVARAVGLSEQAAESALARARRAFRNAYVRTSQ